MTGINACGLLKCSKMNFTFFASSYKLFSNAVYIKRVGYVLVHVYKRRQWLFTWCFGNVNSPAIIIGGA